MLSGKKADKDSLEKAANILKEADALMGANKETSNA